MVTRVVSGYRMSRHFELLRVEVDCVVGIHRCIVGVQGASPEPELAYAVRVESGDHAPVPMDVMRELTVRYRDEKGWTP